MKPKSDRGVVPSFSSLAGPTASIKLCFFCQNKLARLGVRHFVLTHLPQNNQFIKKLNQVDHPSLSNRKIVLIQNIRLPF
jgi:hypothetical protein